MQCCARARGCAQLGSLGAQLGSLGAQAQCCAPLPCWAMVVALRLGAFAKFPAALSGAILGRLWTRHARFVGGFEAELARVVSQCSKSLYADLQLWSTISGNQLSRRFISCVKFPSDVQHENNFVDLVYVALLMNNLC